MGRAAGEEFQVDVAFTHQALSKNSLDLRIHLYGVYMIKKSVDLLS